MEDNIEIKDEIKDELFDEIFQNEKPKSIVSETILPKLTLIEDSSVKSENTLSSENTLPKSENTLPKSEVKTAEYIIGQNLEYEKHYQQHYIDPLYVQSKPQNMKKPLSAAALEIYEKSVSKMENKLLETKKDKNSDMPKLKAIVPKLTPIDVGLPKLIPINLEYTSNKKITEYKCHECGKVFTARLSLIR